MLDGETPLWSGHVAATLTGVRDLRRHLLETVKPADLDPELCESLALCLSEIANNIVHHGTDITRIEAALTRHQDGITLTIDDNGHPLRTAMTHFRRHAARKPDPLQESGRGLYIMASRFPHHLYVPGFRKSPEQPDGAAADGCDVVHVINRFVIRYPNGARNTLPRLLIVDDDAVQRLTISHYLKDSYRVAACASAAEAEIEARLETPDAIISDIHMPDADGLAFREQLSLEPDLALVPFLFLTSDRSPGASAAANDAGIDDLLYKPLDKGRLLSVLERLLKRHQQRRQLHRAETIRASLQFPAPQLPDRVGRYQLSVRSIVAGTAAANQPDAGGDLIWYRHTPDMFQLLFCDAMGHGATAWPRAMANLGFVKGAAMGMGASVGPGAFIARLNDLLSDEGLLDGGTVTALGCWLGADGHVTLANAGLPHPLLLSGGHVRPIPIDGALIGLIAGQSYETTGLTLAPGDRLILVTDGFIDVGEQNTDTDYQRMIVATLLNHADQSAATLCEEVLGAHLQHWHGKFIDDSMICVISYD